MSTQNYEYYNKYSSCYISTFLKNNPEFDSDDFIEYVVKYNKGDRDSGELQDVAKHEILRLAYEYEERKWRFPNSFGESKE